MGVGSVAPLAAGARAVGVRSVETRAPPEQTRRMVRLLAARPGSRGRLRVGLARAARRVIATRAWERVGYAPFVDDARERSCFSARQLVRAKFHVGRSRARGKRARGADRKGEPVELRQTCAQAGRRPESRCRTPP